MIETLQDPKLVDRAIDRAIGIVPPPQYDETLEEFARRVATRAIRDFEIQVDLMQDEQRKEIKTAVLQEGFYRIKYRGWPGVGYWKNNYWALIYKSGNPSSSDMATSAGTGVLYAATYEDQSSHEKYIEVFERLPI